MSRWLYDYDNCLHRLWTATDDMYPYQTYGRSTISSADSDNDSHPNPGHRTHATTSCTNTYSWSRKTTNMGHISRTFSTIASEHCSSQHWRPALQGQCRDRLLSRCSVDNSYAVDYCPHSDRLDGGYGQFNINRKLEHVVRIRPNSNRGGHQLVNRPSSQRTERKSEYLPPWWCIAFPGRGILLDTSEPRTGFRVWFVGPCLVVSLFGSVWSVLCR